MLIQRAVTLALVVVLSAMPCLGICSGWMPSAHERMACCADKAQDEADSCCASGEGRNSDAPSGFVPVVVAPEPVALELAAAVAAEPVTLRDLASHDPLTADSERHVLLSVFLI